MPFKDREKQYEYMRQSSILLSIRFMHGKDDDLIGWLKTQSKPSVAIKDVLRTHIGSIGKEKEQE